MKVNLYLRGLFTSGWNQTRLVVNHDDTICNVMEQIEDLTSVPPILQRIEKGIRQFYYDTPGTLVDLKLVDMSCPDYPVTVSVTLWCDRGWSKLESKTLRNLGFFVEEEHPSVEQRDYTGLTMMFIRVMDLIRKDGGEMQMRMVVAAEDTVASIMERVQHRRRYPVAMQRYNIRNKDERRPRSMDKPDATLADYDVSEDTEIMLCANMEFVYKADREKRRLKKAKETAAAAAHGDGGKQEKLADDEK